MKSKCCFGDLKRLEFKCLRLFTIKRRLVKNRKSKTLLHFLLLRLRGIHQFSKLINRLKRLCVYFYYGANKSCSRAMWGSRQSDAISFFFTASYVLNIRTFSWWSRVMSSLFIPMAWKYASNITLFENHTKCLIWIS